MTSSGNRENARTVPLVSLRSPSLVVPTARSLRFKESAFHALVGRTASTFPGTFLDLDSTAWDAEMISAERYILHDSPPYDSWA